MSRGRKLLLMASLVCAASLALHTFLAPDGWARRERARADLATLDKQIGADEAQAQVMRQEIDALRARPEVQERVVRDELGYVRPGERVIEFSRP